MFGFHLFLRKSNLIPDTRQFDDRKQFQRKDFRYHDNVMLAHIKWSKTNQCKERKLLLPLVRNFKTLLCPVFWFRYMSMRIPAFPEAPAFCVNINNKLQPVTYREAQAQMRLWLQNIGENPLRYSMHSLRRGGTSVAFEANLPSLAIKTLGDWASDSYLTYIDITLDTRMKAWNLFSLQD